MNSKGNLIIAGILVAAAIGFIGLGFLLAQVSPSVAPPIPEGGDDISACVCTMEYAPVCGVDGKTYGNACAARCMKVAIAYQGECQVKPSPSSTHELCLRPAQAVCFAGPIAEDTVVAECSDNTFVYKAEGGSLYHGKANLCR